MHHINIKYIHHINIKCILNHLEMRIMYHTKCVFNSHKMKYIFNSFEKKKHHIEYTFNYIVRRSL